MKVRRIRDVTSDLVSIIKDFGFPIVAAMGLGYFVYYIWGWVTTEIKPVLGDASSTLIKLVDRIRMLDNDMIRLNTKLSMVLEYKEEIVRSGRSDELTRYWPSTNPNPRASTPRVTARNNNADQ